MLLKALMCATPHGVDGQPWWTNWNTI